MPHDTGEDEATLRERLEALKRENEALRQELHLAKLAEAGPGLMREAFQNAAMAYHSLDAEGRLRLVSRGWLDLFGYERAEVLGKRFGSFAAPESLEPLRQSFRTMLQDGIVSGFELTCLRKNGERFTLSIDGLAMPGADGNFFCTYCLLRDVTEEKKARRLLERSEHFYRSLFDSAALPIAIARNLIVLYANAAMAGIVGVAGPESLVGTSVLDYLTPREQELFLDRARRRAKGENVPNQYETMVQRPDGASFPALATVSLIELPDGPATIGFFQDISEHKRMADFLLLSETRFRRLFDSVPAIAVQGYSQDRSVIYWNQASTDLYGYTREEALGRKLEDLIIPPHMQPGVVEAIRAWVEDGQAIPSGELVLMRKDGELVPVFSCHVMQQLGDGSSELYCLDVDLSELHAAKEELTRARDAAEAANKAKSEFLANMSHEIRTPMNGVLGMLQLLMDGNLDGVEREYAELALQSSRRLLALLNDILDFSRIESGKLSLAHAPFKLGELMESVRRVFSVNAARAGIDLTLKVDASADEALMGDEARLRQILFNLVGNALKFTSQGSVRAEVWAGPEPKGGPQFRRVHLCVSDTGTGIAPEKILLMFERFTQSDSSYTRQHEGAGLGLAIVKRIVDLMDGHIVVDSEVGQGTSVTVSIPMRRATPRAGLAQRRARATSGQGGAAAGFRPLAILLAEDDRISQMYMRELLTRLGHTVTVASNGAEAVAEARRAPFDCVFMDVQMPEMDGLEATRAIRTNDAALGRPGSRIIAMTAYALTGDKAKFLAAGMDDYISKPVQDQDLVRALKRLSKERS